MRNLNKKKIVVFAGNHCKESKQNYYFSLAYELGTLLAKAGFIVVTGGGPGLMDKVSQGAFDHGGETVGICLAVTDRKRSKFLKSSEKYHSLSKRQNRLVSLGDGFIAVPGGIGTLSEISQVLALKRKKEININQPLICVTSFYKYLENLFNVYIDDGFTPEDFNRFYDFVDNPKEAIVKLRQYFL